MVRRGDAQTLSADVYDYVRNAKEFEADLVVVGSHGRGPIAATVLGSVSAEVAETAPCSVLVARGDGISRLTGPAAKSGSR